MSRCCDSQPIAGSPALRMFSSPDFLMTSPLFCLCLARADSDHLHSLVSSLRWWNVSGIWSGPNFAWLDHYRFILFNLGWLSLLVRTTFTYPWRTIIMHFTLSTSHIFFSAQVLVSSRCSWRWNHIFSAGILSTHASGCPAPGFRSLLCPLCQCAWHCSLMCPQDVSLGSIPKPMTERSW